MRAGAGDPGQPLALRRSGGGMRARRGEGARWLRLLLPPLSLPLLPLSLPPPEIARGAGSSVDVRGGRARLLLRPPRSAERGPTSEKGGRSGGLREAGRCVCGVPADPVERAWERAQRGGWSRGTYSGNPAPRPSLQREFFGLVLFFFFFLDQARFSDLG